MHSKIVVMAPSSFCKRSSDCEGVASLLSLVPRPVTDNQPANLVEGMREGLTGPAETIEIYGWILRNGIAGFR